MTVAPDEPWQWLALAGLGFFHGVNPAMGWLFAVALGLHRQSRKVVLLSWVPIALGHAAAIAAVLLAVLALGLVMHHATLQRIAAGILIGWAIWHAVRGHRQRLRFGMQTGLAGLALWSFLMSSAHGAGLMLVPMSLPLCASRPARLTSDRHGRARRPYRSDAGNDHRGFRNRLRVVRGWLSCALAGSISISSGWHSCGALLLV